MTLAHNWLDVDVNRDPTPIERALDAAEAVVAVHKTAARAGTSAMIDAPELALQRARPRTIRASSPTNDQP